MAGESTVLINSDSLIEEVKKFLQLLDIKQYNKDVENEVLSYIETYVTSVIEDALDYSMHAGKTALDIKDICLAIKLLEEHNFACAPSVDVLYAFSRPSKMALSDIEIFCNQPQFPSTERQQDTEQFRKNEMCTSKPFNEETSLVKEICSPKPPHDETSSDIEVFVLKPGGNCVITEESSLEKCEDSSDSDDATSSGHADDETSSSHSDDEMSSDKTDST